MKNKVVVWGTNTDNEKVLIALELKADANKVMLHTFPEAIANAEFVNKMMSEWRDGKPVTFPEGHSSLERELNVTESLLPDDLKTDRGDLIQRAQTEWHFAVLSVKLHTAYQQELAEFKEKIESLSAYDNKIWVNLRAFWDKVQRQSRERNLFRDHADNLRDNINVLFEDLKKIRSRVNSEFMSASQSVFDEFNKALDDIEARMTVGGSKINILFEELKKLQSRYREARMSNEHRGQLWDRLDGAFKKAKERKFGRSPNDDSVIEHNDRRLGGLSEAIKRMEDSVRRDEDELNFQRKKVNASEGQLEAQIRMAKIRMIEERLVAKREKLAEMQHIRNDVERQSNTAKDREARREAKETERKKIDAAKEAVKSEIAAQIKAKSESSTPAEKAGEFFEAASTMLGDVLMDALDTARAVASVAGEKAEGIMDEVVHKASEKVEEILESFKKEDEPAVEKKEAEKPGIIIDDVVHASEEGLESTQGIIDDVVHKTAKKDGIIDDVVHASEEGLESTQGIIDDVVHKTAKKDGIIDDVVHASEEGLESTQGIIDDVVHKTAKKDGIIDDVVHASEEGLESTQGIIDDVVHKTAKKDGIIDDVVHASEEGLESTQGIIDDVVHKTVESPAKAKKPKPAKKTEA